MFQLKDLINAKKSPREYKRLSKKWLFKYRKDCYLYGASCFKGVKFEGLPTEKEMALSPEKAFAVEDFYKEMQSKPKPWYLFIVVIDQSLEGEFIHSVTEPLTTKGITELLTTKTQSLVNEYPNNIGYGWMATQSRTFDLVASEGRFVDFLFENNIEDQELRARLVNEYYQELVLKGLVK